MKRRPLFSLTPRDIDRMREVHDREMEFRENSGEREEWEQRQQEAWLTRIDEDAA